LLICTLFNIVCLRLVRFSLALIKQTYSSKGPLLTMPNVCVPETLVRRIIHHYSFITDCGSPPVGINAAVAVYSTTLLGSTASYTCDVGFGINGSGVISCISSGWEALSECVKGDDCVNAQCFVCLFSLVPFTGFFQHC